MSRWSESSKANEEVKKSRSFRHNPNNYLRDSSKTSSFLFIKEEQQGRSSKEERKVNALALRAEEGRDNLRKAVGSRKWASIHRSPNGATPVVKNHGSLTESIG